MNKLILVLTFFITVNAYGYEKLQTVNGVQVPEGYDAITEGNQSVVMVMQQTDEYADADGKNILDITYTIINNKVFSTMVDTELYHEIESSTHSSTILFTGKNGVTSSHTIKWDNATFSEEAEGSYDVTGVGKTYYKGKNTVFNNDIKLNKFLSTLTEDTKVVVTFHGNKDISKTIPKKYVKLLYSMVLFRKQLDSK